MTKLQPWFIAQTIKAMCLPTVTALKVQQIYWETWHDVFREVK